PRPARGCAADPRPAVVRATAGPGPPRCPRHAPRTRLAHRARMPQPVAVLAGRRLGRGFLTSTPELAGMAALPQDLAVAGLERARAKPSPVPVAVATGGGGAPGAGGAGSGGAPGARAGPGAGGRLLIGG